MIKMGRICDNCPKMLEEDYVYSHRGHSFICCSITCLANLELNVREMTLKETLNAMGMGSS